VASQRYPPGEQFPQPRRGALIRRGLLTRAAGVILLAACGNDGDAEEASSDATPTAAGGDFPVTVTHQYGDTTVPWAPTRVLSLGYTDHNVLLALGVVPVGIQQ
jgi:iron complex transport system substrate-binding protein